MQSGDGDKEEEKCSSNTEAVTYRLYICISLKRLPFSPVMSLHMELNFMALMNSGQLAPVLSICYRGREMEISVI